MKRKMYGIVLVILSIFLTPVCNSNETPERFNFSTGSPIEFLNFLKVNRAKKIYTIHEPILNWVKVEHIPPLIALLKSEDECMAVVMEYSSTIRPGSTIGDEAAFLIAGYRIGKYPADLHSGRIDKDEILNWWSHLSKSDK